MNFDHRLLRNMDKLLLIAVAALVALGFLVISSAARGYIGPDGASKFVIKQAIALVLGSLAIVVILFFDYADFGQMSRLLYILNLAMLAAVLAIGKVTNGAQSWIPVGPLHIEPGEVGKLLMILTMAQRLTQMDRLETVWDLIGPALYLLPPLALLLLQPDLGTALVYIVIAAAMIYVAGFPGWKLALLGGVPLAGISAWVYAHMRFGVPLPLMQHQIERLITFVNPSADPTGAGYQLLQSIISIGSGGFWGKGLFQGTQNQLGFLPEQHTDFIFSVVGEELGFLGGALVILLFMLLIWRIMAVADGAKDRYGQLVATGVAAFIAFHVLENVGMTMGVMPVTGIPLPFISYGGSSLMTNLAAIGLVLNVGMRRNTILF